MTVVLVAMAAAASQRHDRHNLRSAASSLAACEESARRGDIERARDFFNEANQLREWSMVSGQAATSGVAAAARLVRLLSGGSDAGWREVRDGLKTQAAALRRLTALSQEGRSSI